MPVQLPLFPLGAVLLPGMILPLHIFEERYRKLMRQRIDDDPAFGVVLTRAGREVGDQPEIHDIGTAATLRQVVRYSDGRFDIAVSGGRRFRVLGGDWGEGYLTGTIEWLPDDVEPGAGDALAENAELARSAFDDYLTVLERTASVEIERQPLEGEPARVGYAICAMMPLPMGEKQRLLEIGPTTGMLQELVATLVRERALLASTGVTGPEIDHPGVRFSSN
ncbi:MAG: LON peptidase substrate-binding domain-containing protein [Thermomicrobiales bacterium]|nr:LON peptidase substrate-binding domain-containing protein [Thermomicrobiales bacterium]